MGMPYNSRQDALEALSRLDPLLPAETHTVMLYSGLDGWQVQVRATSGPGVERAATRMGLVRREEADWSDESYHFTVWTGRSARVAVLLTSSTHRVTRALPLRRPGGPPAAL